ncbi:MAG TPA: 30S ribosomal protein S20 [Chloroflexota bacterium]|jgi:small subunit ribosomal protein S20|nr:30S ribosomal protein S20 [Chloroflexota bacterium]
MPKGKGKNAERRAKEVRRNTERNRSTKSAVKTLMVNAVHAIEDDVDASDAAIIKAQKALDTAVTHGVIHRNNAARRLSRLMKKFNRAVLAS